MIVAPSSSQVQVGAVWVKHLLIPLVSLSSLFLNEFKDFAFITFSGRLSWGSIPLPEIFQILLEIIQKLEGIWLAYPSCWLLESCIHFPLENDWYFVRPLLENVVMNLCMVLVLDLCSYMFFSLLICERRPTVRNQIYRAIMNIICSRNSMPELLFDIVYFLEHATLGSSY